MAHNHELTQKLASTLIAQHRDYIGIEPKWHITLDILCEEQWHYDDEMPDGTVAWIPDTYEAEISIRCDLLYGRLRRVIVHELVELSWYRTGTLYDQVSEDLGDLFIKQYRVARNQEVELLVDLYLGESGSGLVNTPIALWQQRRRQRRI